VSGHVARMGKFMSENVKGRYYLEDLGIDGGIILE